MLILELPCSSDLASQIIRERDGALKTACARPGVLNNWFNRFTAAKLEAKSKGVPVLTNLPIYLQMLDLLVAYALDLGGRRSEQQLEVKCA